MLGDKHDEYPELWRLIIIIWVVFVTQAKVERGFSENKNQVYTNAGELNIEVIILYKQ